MGEVAWSSDLYPGHFSQYLMNTYTNVDIIDSLGNKLFEWVWNPFIHGDFAHQYFEIWSLNNLGSNGIAIGTHNGMTGEWVGPVIKGRLKTTLVEASEPQFKDLLKYYNGKFAAAYFYDRVLSASEITQNFDAVKTRFGL
jgi:hypothetical protein